MQLKLQNTLTRQREVFRPLEDGKVKIYTCGLTVYSHPHIGNWVGYIYWDVLVRLLDYLGYDVMRVQNITDVGHLTSDDDSGEDKLQKGAEREGITAWDIADKYLRIADHEAYDLLKLRRPNTLLRATDLIDQQIAFVGLLEKKGYTYEIPDEGVYFDTAKVTDYGKLARLDIEGLQAGARVPISGKRNITDFALWKFSPKTRQRDMEWDSPWGRGFPGWHLECSTIAREVLGDQIDIHTGGVDHIPVHHTNEIAQTESLTGKQFATYWLHNNHLRVEGGKMSKSRGNIYTLDDIQSRGFRVMAFKVMVLGKHYRTEGNFTWKNLEAAQNRLNGLEALADLRWQPQAAGGVDAASVETTRTAVLAALCDDLNTPEALTALNQLENQAIGAGIAQQASDTFAELIDLANRLFGLELGSEGDITTEQKEMLAQRQSARDSKDYAAADALRDKLAAQGITVKDVPTGQLWTRAR